MKKLGLIGGSGPESTLIYYKELNTKINRLTGEACFPEMTIESIDLYKISRFRLSEDLKGMTEYLLEHIDNLQKAGCQLAALTAGTLHMVYDELAQKSPLPLISIPAAVSRYAVEKGYKKVGILGTGVTMRKDFLKKDFTEKGIQVFTPNEEEMDLVDHRIFSELEKAVIKESTLLELQQIITRMKDNYGIEAVILGCTELPLILNENNSPVPVLDIMRIHIDELTALILDDK